MKKQIIIITLIIAVGFISYSAKAQTELIYNGGVYSNSIKLKPKDVKELMKNDSVALSKYKSGRILYITGKCIFYPFILPVGLGLFYFGIAATDDGGGWLFRDAGLIGAVLTTVGGVGMLLGYCIYDSGENKMKQSVELYNKNLNSNKVSVNFGLTGNGIGLNVRF